MHFKFNISCAIYTVQIGIWKLSKNDILEELTNTIKGVKMLAVKMLAVKSFYCISKLFQCIIF